MDWDGEKAKAREQNNLLLDFSDPKPQTNTDQTTDIDKVAFSNLQIRQDDLKREEPIEVTELLIWPPEVIETQEEAMEMPGEVTGKPMKGNYQKQITGYRKKKKS